MAAKAKLSPVRTFSGSGGWGGRPWSKGRSKAGQAARKLKVRTLRIASVPISLFRRPKDPSIDKADEGEDRVLGQSEPGEREGTPPVPSVLSSRLKPGHSYLVEEEKPTMSLKILGDLTREDRPGLFITRKNPKTLAENFELEKAQGLWLVADARSSGNVQALAPSLETVLHRVNEFVQANPRGAILIDGVEYLVDTNNFSSVLGFLRRAVDMVSQGEQIPKRWGNRERSPRDMGGQLLWWAGGIHENRAGRPRR